MKSNTVRWMERCLVGGAMGVLALATGCSGNADDGSATQAIGAQGGTLSVQSGAAQGAAIQIPAGALSTTVQITIRAGAATATNLPAGDNGVGGIVVFGPEGQRFAMPVTITIPTTSAGDTLYTRPVGGTEWTAVEGATYDANRHAMIAQVAHFSEFIGAHHGGGTPCRADSDCASGALCIAGTCAATGADAGTDSGACVPHAEVCNGVDDDCNGIIDDGIVCSDAAVDAGLACATNADCPAGVACIAGVCGGGAVDGGSDGGTCVPHAEVCNGVDDDCNGIIDDGIVCGDAAVDGGLRCAADADCAAGERCVSGACEAVATDGGTSGDGGLSCVSDSDCPAGGVCVSRVCEPGATDAGVTCPSGRVECGGACVDLNSDAHNCGSCGVSCPSGHSCAFGACM